MQNTTNDMSEYDSSSSSDDSMEEVEEYCPEKRSFDLAFGDEGNTESTKKHRRSESFHEESFAANSSTEEVEATKDVFEERMGSSMSTQWTKSFDSFDKDNKFGSVAFEDAETSSRASFCPVNMELRAEDKSRTNTSESQKDKGSIASKLMERMGWTGQGLGKDGRGIIEPVQAAKQRGFRGLGFHLEELEEAHSKFNPDDEIVKVEEDIEWLRNDSFEELHIPEDWMTLGPKKLTIDNETHFCSPGTVDNVIHSKNIFDRLDKTEMRDARTRSNPFETIRSAFFLNRAALKMANIDRACNFMFTKPKNLKKDELLYFADVCAGPGGFSEYVLFKEKWRAKGFGFTLKRENDFKLNDFSAGPSESFHPYYGSREDGNVFWPENQISLRDLIMQQTKGEGVHFMMSDGGFSVEGQENIQEILSKQLYLCQCLIALMIVRTGGHFVTKLFDVFTPFSAGLIYIMHRCFDEISIFKPNTSRPANSERYLICKGKRAETKSAVTFFYIVNQFLQNKDKINDVLHLVPLDILKGDPKFFHYLKDSNDELGRRQVVGLLKIAHYAEEKHLIEHRQAEMHEDCLRYWGIPNKTKSVPRKMRPDEKFQSLLKRSLDFLDCYGFQKVKRFTQDNIKNTVLNCPLDWYCMPCASGENNEQQRKPTFYLGMGRGQVFRLIGKTWERANNIILPADTLIYAECVTEYKKVGRHQRKAERLHVLDAVALGGEDISKKYLLERHRLLKLFCESLWKPFGQECHIFVKDLYQVDEHLAEKLNLVSCPMKSGPPADVYFPSRSLKEYNAEDDDKEFSYFKMRSVVFVKATEDYWARHRSAKHGSIYFYNIKERKSYFEEQRPSEAVADFVKTQSSAIVWNWPEDNVVTMEYVMGHIRHALVKKTFSLDSQ